MTAALPSVAPQLQGCSTKLRTEVLQVMYTKRDGEICHLVGLRDFTDTYSAASSSQPDDFLDAWDPCSPAMSEGDDEGAAFHPHLRQTQFLDVAALAEGQKAESASNEVFSYEDMPVCLSRDSSESICGTMQLVQTQTGINILLAFQTRGNLVSTIFYARRVENRLLPSRVDFTEELGQHRTQCPGAGKQWTLGCQDRQKWETETWSQQEAIRLRQGGPVANTELEEAICEANREASTLQADVQRREEAIAHLSQDLRSVLEDFLPNGVRAHLGLGRYGEEHLDSLCRPPIENSEEDAEAPAPPLQVAECEDAEGDERCASHLSGEVFSLATKTLKAAAAYGEYPGLTSTNEEKVLTQEGIYSAAIFEDRSGNEQTI
ncbi:hypothetical protein AK812_SmicGene2429 [Symbiodinium microadriaticum]|uniref:Uncharacterized protein n=1 Tax=Symbiodinium microadriaticum TaxID=2951 RepID=A0A1Q9F1K2_SYMMI|nr:hypothetical protein AK812_SmicGene2429 [Symbiodinium microadriaticum]